MNIEKVSLCNVSLVYDSLVSHFVFFLYLSSGFQILSSSWSHPVLWLSWQNSCFCNRRKVVPI